MSQPRTDNLKHLLSVLTHIYEIERKLKLHGDSGRALRNIERIREEINAGLQLFYEDPAGQPFAETRTDLEATISGPRTDSLVVVEVVKPIIRLGNASYSRVVQKGIVVVQAKQA
jgi:hypothetical protein